MSTREEYVRRLKAKLDEWNAEIDLLEARARQFEAQAEQEFHKQIADLKSRREDAENKLHEIQHASEEAWHTLKKGADQLWENVTATMRDTKKAFFDGLK